MNAFVPRCTEEMCLDKLDLRVKDAEQSGHTCRAGSGIGKTWYNTKKVAYDGWVQRRKRREKL